MWSTLRLFWDVRKGKRAAVAAILPLVDKSRYRFNGIADSTWLEPYVVGFMMMLITLAARRHSPLRDMQSLALVQAEAWAAITGLKSDLIGEETLLLSSARHQDFERGCRNAALFCDTLFKEAGSLHDPLADAGGPVCLSPDSYGAPDGGAAAAHAVAASMWELYFDDNIRPA